MYVIDVIPLSRTAPGVLTYRSKDDLSVGTIVTIMVRKTETQGIVIDSVPVADAKEMLKHARFLLSKTAPAPSGMLPDAVLRAAESVALYHATTTGAVLTAMFSEQIRTGVELPVGAFSDGIGFARETCELPIAERMTAYSSRIRECIEAGSTALLIAPTLPELSYWKDVLKAFDPLMISGALTGAKRVQALEKAATHRGLIIATPSFAWVPVHSLGVAILDRISAGTYVLPKRPCLSILRAVEALMRERNVPLLYGDFPLPIEYRDVPDAGLSETVQPVTVIDARVKKDEMGVATTPQDGPWAALPKELVHAIGIELENEGRVVVLAARKGYAPAVVCRDCGQAQADERGMPYSFSLSSGSRIFRTSDGETTAAKHTCQRCGSWNLLPLGVGAERVEEELRAAFPKANIISVPPESLISPRKAKAAIQAFQEHGSVIVGTEALLPWLQTGEQGAVRAPLGVIASADSLLSQPFWRARERFVRLIYFMQGICRDVVLVTRRPDDTAVDAVAHPGSDAFWREESALRSALMYPPYGTLITLSVEGSARRAALDAERISEELAAYAPHLLPARPIQGALWRAVIVLSVSGNQWPDEALSKRLQLLPPNVRVRLDPESLW